MESVFDKCLRSPCESSNPPQFPLNCLLKLLEGFWRKIFHKYIEGRDASGDIGQTCKFWAVQFTYDPWRLDGGHFLCAGGKLFGMDQDAINKAVKDCVREALGQHEPLLALQGSLDALKTAGWPNAEIEIVRNTCLRMLRVIYDADGSEEKDQAQ